MAPEVGGRDATGLRFTDGAPFRPAARHGAQHDEHDRDRTVHHDPAPDVRAGWSAGDARLARCAGDRAVRRHGLERAGSGGAGFRRIVRVSAPRLWREHGRPADGLPVRRAVRAQWPLEIASGYIGFSQYLGYIWKGITARQTVLVVAAIGLVNIALLYRRITSIATITLPLWIGTILTVIVVVVTGALHFDSRVAFDFPPGAFTFSLGFLLGLGAASRIGVYDYLGYYDVCYIGDEVENPGRVIPRSILISTLAVAAIYLAINLSIIGVVPWRDFVPAATHPQSNFVVSIFMERIYGSRVATVFTAMILWTAFGSVFALLLGYSRVPYAAAKDGYFFKVFARLHATEGFPWVSLVVLGVLSILAGFVSLGMVIDALITTRILVQFVGQIGALTLLRRRAPDMPRPYRMWLYPLPSLVALLGWIFVFATTPLPVIAFGLGALLLGVICFCAWSWKGKTWPFAA